MTDESKPVWAIDVKTVDGETYIGKMTKKQPELVNGFVAIATDSGDWVYLKPESVLIMRYTVVEETQE